MINARHAQLADAIEAAAFRDMVAALPPELARRLGMSCREIAGATLLFASNVPDVMFNRVIGLGVFQPATEADVDAVIAAYRVAGCRSYWVHCTPTALPADLPHWLQERGFQTPRRRTWAKMLRGADPPPRFETDLSVRAAKPEESAPVGEAVCEAFGMPSVFAAWLAGLAHRPAWHPYAAFDGSAVAGGGYLYVEGATAWLGVSSVRAPFRGRNAHRALMALRIRDAIAAGCTQIVTETGEPVGDEPNPSLANMYRCGFALVCSRANYASPSS
jgi:hypothetical protein